MEEQKALQISPRFRYAACDNLTMRFEKLYTALSAGN
jgi:hypothetical protein